MDKSVAISVENISKCFQIYEKPHHRLFQGLLPGSRKWFKEFWALRDISLTIKKGEVVGIIGRNGSGKSTLLQLICGTLTPTTGQVRVNGKIAALLELGAGFNPEFTGRENIYMNGAIHGLSREAVDRKYHDIITFADIGDFVDRPVKTYSSGMYVRLAFAVIIHVDADILIVDEALSVGDAFFQSKCLLKLHEMIARGVTILFVSHDTSAVKSLCNACALLDQGTMVDHGDTSRVIEKYFSMNRCEVVENRASSPEKKNNHHALDITALRDENFNARAAFQRISTGGARFINVQLLDGEGNVLEQVNYDQRCTLRMTILAEKKMPALSFGYHIRDRLGKDIIYSDSMIENCRLDALEKDGIAVIDWTFNTALAHGDYTVAAMLSIPVDLSISKVDIVDFVPIAVQFQVLAREPSYLYGAVHWHNKVNISFPVTGEQK